MFKKDAWEIENKVARESSTKQRFMIELTFSAVLVEFVIVKHGLTRCKDIWFSML